MKIATILRHMDLKNNTEWSCRYYLPIDYMLMAERHRIGMLSILSEYDLEETVRVCDGLFVPGSGTNIDPTYYGGAPFDPPNVVDEYALDQKIIRAFYEAGKPIFGICGGEQAINVFFGGTLAKVPDLAVHMDMEKRDHPINIVGGSFVHDVFKTERAVVNSHHSWWTDNVAPDLRVAAVTDDGIVEAIEWPEKHIYATQWHPELMYHKEDTVEIELFKSFLRACEG